jgi:membrane-bound ClpP family serine protease
MRLFGIILFLVGLLLLIIFPPRGEPGALMLVGLILYVVGRRKRKAPEAKDAENMEKKA